MNKPILTKYIGLVYFFLLLEFAVSYLISKYIIIPNPGLEKFLKQIYWVFFILAFCILLYILFGEYSLTLKRTASVFMAIGIYLLLHFTLKEAKLSESEMKSVIIKLVIGFVLMTVIGIFMAKNFSESAYSKYIFGFSVMSLMAIMLIFLEGVINKNDNKKILYYIGLVMIMGFLAFDTWGLYTKYGDPSPFFASLDIYYDVAYMFIKLIKLSEE